MSRIYLDHAATTPVRAEVLDAMRPYFTEHFANASSIHRDGQKAKKALEDARDTVAGCLGAQPKEIVFTSGGTESDNLAIQGTAHAARDRGRHIITSAIEHQAVLQCCAFLEKHGCEVTRLPVDRFGVASPAALEKAIRPDTALVTVMLANNETGTLQPIAEIARITKSRGVLLHTDAVQAAGKIPVDADDLGVDLLSISGHKLYGPKGVGVLYVRKGTRITPLHHGGHHEHHLRPGTENVAGIVGLAKALQLACEEMPTVSARLVQLRDRLHAEIREKIPHTALNGHPERRLPNILNLSFRGVEGESLLLTLDMRGIAASTGSACTSGSLEMSHVLKAMGIEPAAAQGSLRFSLGRDNTAEQMDRVVDALSQIVPRLREMSPVDPESLKAKR